MSRLRYALLGAAIFALTASVGQVFALLADFKEEFNLPDGGAGLIASMSFFSAVIGQLTLAPLADKGHTRVLLVAGMVFACAGSIAFALSSSLWPLVGARILTGLGLGAFLPSVRALVGAEGAHDAGVRLGRISSVEVTGFIVSPFIGAELASRISLAAPFWTSAVIAAAFIPIVAFMPLPERRIASGARSIRTSLRLLERRPVLVAFLAGVALYLPAGIFEAVWSIYLEDLGASTQFVGRSLLLYGVPFVFVSSFAGRYSDQYGAMRVTLAAVALIVPITALYGIINSLYVLISLAAVEAVINAFGIPGAMTAMAHATYDDELASGQGLVGAGGQVMAGTMAVLAEPTYVAFGPEAVFVGAAAIIGALAVAAAVLQQPSAILTERPVADTF